MGLHQGQVINLVRLLGYFFLVPSTLFQQKFVGSISGILIKTTPTPLTKLAHMAATAAMASGVIDGIPEGIDSSPSSTSDGPFRLLDLPPELVARITGFVNSEGLIATRRACRAIEAITFERFAAENFEHIYCWIRTNQDFDRLKDIIRLSPRLSSRIRQLTLTADVLRGEPFSTLQRVRESYMDDEKSQYWTMAEQYFLHTVCINTLNVLRTLQDTRRLPQHVSVVADLAFFMRTQIVTISYCSPVHVMLLSLMMSRLKVQSLKIDRQAFDDPDGLLVHNREDIINAMSTLTTFEFVGKLPHEQMPIYEDIVRSAPQLRNLAFDTTIKDRNQIATHPLTSQLMLVQNTSSLTSLRITRAVINGEDLIRALYQCQTTLSHPVLRVVTLSTIDEDWVSILATMLTMPELDFLELQLIQAGQAQIGTNFEVPYRYRCQESHIFEGRGHVTGGIRSLSGHHLCLHI
jgi:hypothetical protein